MTKKIKTIRKFNQRYRSFSFSELMSTADEEYLETVTELDPNGNVLLESKLDQENELEEKNTFTYGPHGKLTEHVLLYAVDDVTEKRILNRDEKGRLLEEIKYYGDDSGERTAYVYDEKDNVTAINHFDEEGVFSSKEEILYDDKGSIRERIKYNSGDELEERVTFTQNSDDHSIEQLDFDTKGELKSRTIYKVNEEGKEESSIQSTSEGKLIASVQSVYDDKGNLTERHYKDFYSKSVIYTYDEENRMTSQELYDGSGLLLRKNIYEYGPEGSLVAEQTFEMDTTRGGRDKHFGTRYEYEYFEE